MHGIRSERRVPEKLWTEVPNTVQEAGIMTIPKKKKCKKAKWLSQEALQTAEKRREKRKERKISEVIQSSLTPCNPMDCSLPGSSVHGIFQARVLEWVAISFSRGSPQRRDQTWVSRIAGRCFTIWANRETQPGKRREAKGKGEKERYIHLNAEFQRIARRDKKAFLSD